MQNKKLLVDDIRLSVSNIMYHNGMHSKKKKNTESAIRPKFNHSVDRVTGVSIVRIFKVRYQKINSQKCN